jgi:ankyrin repeat protein
MHDSSPSQYELQFKKWGFTKNLKSGEWAALISQYDQLCQTKSHVRITVSGSVLDKNKIDRARRRYRSQHNKTQGAMCKGESKESVCRREHSRVNHVSGGTLPASRQAHVEFLDESGEWTKYSGAELKDSTALILHKSSHIAGDTGLEDENRLNAPRLDVDPCMLRDERLMDTTLSSQDSFPAYRPCSPIMNLDKIFIHPAFSIDDGVFSSLLSSSSSSNVLSEVSSIFLDTSADSTAPKHITSESDQQEMVLGRAASVKTSHLEGARSLITSLVQHGKTTLRYKSGSPAETETPDVEEIMESLESLLPDAETPSQESLDLTINMRNACPSSNLFKTLVYSFTNNFAGLRDVPRTSIMKLIREQHDIRHQLFEAIKSGQPGVSKPLADSFFRAAVEGSDADAVTTIIRHTKCNSKIAINPNDVVCNFEDDDYTPIELAAKFRNTELVRTLVASRADPNKTYKPNHRRKWEQGALGLALGRWDNGSKYPFKPSPLDEPEPINLGLLKVLLDFGAEVRIDLVENATRPGPGHSAVAEELMSRIPASEHRICFESQWLLVSAIHYLENSAADRIIRRLFAHCFESNDCGKCASDHPRLLEKLLCHAARRGNLDLTKFLAQHTAQLQSGLAAAIRASSDELVEFLLNKGARVDDPVESWRQCKHSKECCLDLYDEYGYDRRMYLIEHEHQEEYVITPIRTPLAEAIRSRNDRLINTFERLGAYTRLSDKHHFHAAVLAAAEVGNTSHLKMVLDHASRLNDGSHLTLALAVAIRNDETDTALILLKSGATLDHETFKRMHGDPLIIAIERCNKRVIDYMLDCDVRIMAYSQYNGKSALEGAAAWGDIGLINDLIRLGGDIDTGIKITPLGAAVRSRNKTLVSQILDLGASRKARPGDSDGATPLQAAMEIGDYDMVRFLISKGVPAADTPAFLYAMSHDPVGYEYLLSEFKSQCPHGLKGFGGHLLAQAIELNSQPLMDSLLRAGIDMNSWCPAELTTIQEFQGRTQVFHKHRVLGLAIRNRKAQNYELVRELLDRGAETDSIVYEYERPTSSGIIWIRETPLLLAIKLKKLQVVSLLLEHGAELDRPARRGIKQTPIQAACETGSYRMVEFLLRKGARVNDAAAERYGATALQLAAKSGSLKIVRLLLDNGADPYMPKSKVEGRTAFEAAAESGCVDVLCQLWNAVLPLGFSDKECQSAKEFAKQKGHRGCVGFIDFLRGGPSQSFLHG